MKRHLWFTMVSALGLIGVVGCSHCGSHQALFPNAPWNKGCGCRTTPRATAAPVGIVPGQPMPVGAETSVPPPGSALAPAPGGQPFYPASPSAPIPSAPAPSAPAPSPLEIRGYGPAADSTWHAPTTNGGIQLAIPETAPPRESVRLNSPEAAVNPRQPAVSEGRTAEPPPAAPLPTEIRQFAPMYDRVASGLRPEKTEGLDWLKANGYRAVLYLRRTSDDETSDRREMESRGLKYLSLEIQPQSLRESLEQFNFMVNDSANYPLFVYSRDPMISGSLWYLHFRTVDRLADDAARAKAAPLGLQEEQTEANRPMWLAIQKVLEQVR